MTAVAARTSFTPEQAHRWRIKENARLCQRCEFLQRYRDELEGLLALAALELADFTGLSAAQVVEGLRRERRRVRLAQLVRSTEDPAEAVELELGSAA
jgi:hypothetical protein